MVLALLLIASRPGLAATFFVAPPPAGDDGNPGTLAQPWATLQHAAGELGPGDILEVRAGRYSGMYLTTSGTATERIVIRAYGDEIPIIDTANPITDDGINLEGASHVVVEGFRVEGVPRAGIRAVTCEHVTIRGNTLVDNGVWGILTGFCDDLLIEDNHASGSFDEHGIYVSNSGDRPVIRGNVIFDNSRNGIHMNGDIHTGEDVDGIISEAVVENNILYNNGGGNGSPDSGGGSAINMDGVQDSVIRNNLIYDTHASGISLYRIDGGEPSTGNRVLNNTVLVADDGRWALNIQNASTGNQVFNNILYSHHGFRGSIDIDADALDGFSSDYNVIMNRFTLDAGNSQIDLAEWRAETGQDLHSIIATPDELFVDPAGDDYFPADDSPAIDAGTVLGDVNRDLVGIPRPVGSSHDIGAYEWWRGIFADRFQATP